MTGFWIPEEDQSGIKVGRVSTPSILVLETDDEIPTEGGEPESLKDFTEELGEPGLCNCGKPAKFRRLFFNLDKRLISDHDSCISCSRGWDTELIPELRAWKVGRYQITVSHDEEDVQHALELTIMVAEVMTT